MVVHHYLDQTEVVAWHNTELTIRALSLPPLARAVDNLENIALGERNLSRVVLTGLVRVESLGALQSTLRA